MPPRQPRTSGSLVSQVHKEGDGGLPLQAMLFLREYSIEVGFNAKEPTGGTFITDKGIKKSYFVRFRKNSINVANCKHKIIVAHTYLSHETC